MRALLVTFDKYPDLDAGAVRTHMFGKILIELGYSVHVISMGNTTKYHTVIEPDGIEHTSFRGISQNPAMKVSYYVFFPLRLRAHLKKHDYDVIIHSQLDETSLRIIQSYGESKKIPVVFDSVEWFSETQFPNGRNNRAYKRNNRYNTYLIKKPSSVIAISKYLEENFKSRGITTVRIPVIMDTESTKVEKETNSDYVNLFYAGSPGKKDYLDSVIDAIDLLKPHDQEKLRFTIIGVSSDQLVSMCGVKKDVLDRVAHVLDVRGRVPREQVLAAYSKADFSVLIRPTGQRYAMAGFPTKFVESLCCSTPVICNITSDLSDYAENLVNCIVLNDINPSSIADALRQILSLSKEKVRIMGQNARMTTEQFFDYHKYSSIISNFLEKNEGKGKR